MNWFQNIKYANYQLGENFGKWLVLFSMGQYDPFSASEDIKNIIAANPLDINSSDIEQYAISYFVNKTKRQPNPNELNTLQQWIASIHGPGNLNESTI